MNLPQHEENAGELMAGTSQSDQPLKGTSDVPLCPSAQPDSDGSVAFGIVNGTVEQPEVRYLTEPQPVTSELLSLSKPVRPTEVFRFAAPCAQHRCEHFDGDRCRLVKRIVDRLRAGTDRLPPCRIRPRCRWWREQGREACMRCPRIVTTVHRPSDEFVEVARSPTSVPERSSIRH